jgi:hypothetical protein
LIAVVAVIIIVVVVIGVVAVRAGVVKPVVESDGIVCGVEAERWWTIPVRCLWWHALRVVVVEQERAFVFKIEKKNKKKGL